MEIAPLPPDESARLDALNQYEILDTPPEEAFDSLTRLAAQICGTPIALVSLIDPTRQWFKAKVGIDVPETSRNIAFCAHAILQSDILIVPDTMQDLRFDDNPLVTAVPNIRFYAGMPLITPTGHALGTLCVIDRVPKQLTPEQITALRILGQQVVSHLELRWRTMTLERVLISQKQGEKELRESERRYRTLVECSPFCIHEIDLQGRLLSMNPAGLVMMGAKDEQEIVSLLYPDVVAPVDRKRVEALLDRACVGEASMFEFSVQGGRADCRVASCFVPIKGDDGAVTKLMGITQDITDRKRTEAALQKSEAFLQSILENIPHMVCVKDAQDLRFVRFNRAGEELLGYSRDEMLGKNDYDFFPKAQADCFIAKDREALAGGVQIDIPEEPIETKMLGQRTLHTKKIPIVDAQKRPLYLLGISEDITERKQAEEALRLAKFSMDRAADAVYWIDAQAKVLNVNEAASLMLGYSKDELCAMTVHDLNPDFQVDMWPGFWAETKRRGTMVMETTHRAKNGRLIPIEVSVNYLSYEGKEYHCAFVRDITERTQAEAALREHEAGLVAAQELAHLGSWEWDIQTGTEQWSAEQYRIFGYAPNSIKATYDLFKQALYPEDRERVLASVEAAFNKSAPYDVECRIVHLSGELRFLQCQGDVIRDTTGQPVKMRGTVLDITERKRAEEALHTSELRFRAIFDQTFQFIGLMKTDGTLIEVNRSALQFAGIREQDVLGKLFWDTPWWTHSPELQGRLREAVRQAAGGTMVRFEATHPSPTGELAYVDFSLKPVRDEHGNVMFMIPEGRDITERKQAEERSQAYAKELERTNQSLDIALDQAKAATQAKSNFLATMSHEIRTPMNGVIGMTGLLLDTDLTPEQRDYAEMVSSSGEHLLMVINDILDFSKIEAGKLSIEIIDFDLRTTIDETLDLVARPIADKGVSLACLVHANVPSTLRGDPGRLRQILLNLLSNALKFTAQGEVTIGVSLVDGTDDRATVRFAVQDTGIGLSPEAQGRLFQAFSQADNSTTRKYGGTGLGLAICKQLTELMGGQIGVESQPGAGSTFWFTVPFATLPPGTASVGDKISQDLRGRSLCIVDDHATNRRILESYAAKWGLRCRLALDGPEALACLRAAAAEGAACDFAIIDMQMPGMDGLELARSIKADPVLAPTRLILLTSQGQRGDAQAAQTSGYAAYLTKPVQESRLYECFLAVASSPAPALPCAGQSEIPPAPAALITRHSLAEAKTQGAIKILLAEDNVINQKVATRMLEKLGYRVDVVGNGIEALEALGRIDYAAVLMDCHMPEMDGFEATRLIREREQARGNVELGIQNDELNVPHSSLHTSHFRRLPIIALTASVMLDDRSQCLAIGMDDYISKPVQSKVLAEVLARWITPASPVSAEMGEAGARVKG